MKMEKMRLLDLKLDEKNNFVFEAEYVDKQYVYETYYETNCNIKTIFKKSIMEVLNTYKIAYTKRDIHNYVERMMISHNNGVSLPDYFANIIKIDLIHYLKHINILIDKNNTFYAITFIDYIKQMFNDIAVHILKFLDIQLIDYYVVMLDKVVKVNKDGHITVHYRYDKNLSNINNIKSAIMKTKDKETIKTLKKCLKREISELNDN